LDKLLHSPLVVLLVFLVCLALQVLLVRLVHRLVVWWLRLVVW
jgi:hypothetical protein